jgi:hypothetical protein
MGFETISLQMNDHTDRGLGGRQYGTSEEIETLQGQNNLRVQKMVRTTHASNMGALAGQFSE